MNPLKKYIWLVDTIGRAGNIGLTLEQIGDCWNANDELYASGAFSKRSFHRHRTEITDLFNIEIECYNVGKGYRYRIANSNDNSYFRQWMLNSIAVNRIVTDSQELAQYISLEDCHDTSLPTLLQALKELRMVSFTYSPFWAEEPILYYNFKPHALKMFDRRWYLIGCFGSRKEHRIYALDRISDCELQGDSYKRDPKFSIEKMFEGAYGITVADDIPVERVWIKTDPDQAPYLRTPKLHESQIEIGVKDGCPVFSLQVRPTLDFIQKLLSFGSAIEVLKPERLRKEMKKEAEQMARKYQEE